MSVNKKYTVQTITIIVWTVILNINQSALILSQDLNSEKIKALRLETLMPILSPDDTIQNIVFSEKRYESGNDYVHAIPTTHSQSETTINREGDVIKDTLIALWEKYRFLVFKEGARNGILYDSIDAKTGQLVSIDSMMSLNTITSSSKFINQIIQNDQLINSTESDDSLVETYVPKIKKDITYSDSLILVFSKKMNGFHFTLSDSLDKARGLKLCQFKLIYNGNLGIADVYASKPRKLIMKIEEISIENESEIRQLIYKFRKESVDKKIE